VTEVERRQRLRGALLFVAAVATTGIAALLVPGLPARGALDRLTTGLVVPGVIELCGRQYEGGGGRRWRIEEVREHFGVEPVIVDPWLHPACVPGACTDVAAGACHTVIFARLGPESLAAYGLRGGP
jgi:hypothetical protein